MVKRLPLIIGLLLGFFNSFGQDIHFSQFYASPLSLNPANTGNYTGDWRIMNNYRRQWKSITSPFVTASIGYDHQFYRNNDRFSAGIILINDKSGDSKLTVNKFLLSGGYHKTIAGNNLHVGLQAGIVNKSFDITKLTFPDQYDHSIGDFNSQLNSGSTVAGDQVSYLDLNLGVAWSRKMGKIEPQVGAAIFHLNNPKESFFNTGAKLKPRQSYSIGAKYDLNSKIFILPNVLIMKHTKASDLLFGSNVGYKVKANQYKIASVFGGFLIRNTMLVKNKEVVINTDGGDTDAAVFVGGLNFNKLSIGVSYDYNISDLKVISNHRGAVEFSLIYTGLSTLIDQITIPCDRY